MKRRHSFFFALAIVAGCIEGGANQGGRHAGNRDGGLQLALGEIAVDLGGRYFLSRSDGVLVLGDLDTRTMERLDALPTPDLLAFWTHTSRPGFFLLTWVEDASAPAIEEGEAREGPPSLHQTLLSYDLEARRVVWARALERHDVRLDVSPDGARLVLGDYFSAHVLDAATGRSVAAVTRTDGIQDLDFTPDGARFVVTGWTHRDDERRPWTTIALHASDDGRAICEVTVPNCSAELVLTNDGARGFLAPTFCGRDPVSVVDLADDRCTFVRNLPGFGPVALSPAGDTVVAFVDRDANDLDAPPLPEAVTTSADRYHLAFVDTDTLAMETAPIGAALPRYTFTPDGRALLVDSTLDAEPTPIAILDVDARTFRSVAGPSIELGEHVLTPDGARAYVVDDGLWVLDLAAASLARAELPFRPVSLNLTPAGDALLLKSASDGEVWVWSVEDDRLDGRVTCGAACTGPRT
jgi:hypothetical protein